MDAIRILFLADTHLGFDLPVKPRINRRRRGIDFFKNYEYNGIENSPLMNYWNNNYWDDYIGNDDDNDGYGDTPYNIPSGTDKDSKPLMNPFG